MSGNPQSRRTIDDLLRGLTTGGQKGASDITKLLREQGGGTPPQPSPVRTVVWTIDGKYAAVTQNWQIAAECRRLGYPTWWEQKAGTATLTLGRSPGRIWCLLQKHDIDQMQVDGTFDQLHTLVLGCGQDSVTFVNLVVVPHPVCITPGLGATGRGSPNSTYLVELADPRYLAQNRYYSNPTIRQFNVLAPDSGWVTGTGNQTFVALAATAFYASSLNSGAIWSWQGVLDTLWADINVAELGSSPQLPISPDGVPNNLKFIGISAWDAYNQVLERLSCAFAYWPDGTTSIVQKGTTNPAFTTALARFDGQPWSPYDEVPPDVVRSKVASQVVVYSHTLYEQYGQEAVLPANSTQWSTRTPLYSITVAAPAGSTVAILSVSETGNSVAVSTADIHNFRLGQQVTISGVAVAGYNGTFTITSIPDTTSFTYSNPAAGLAPSIGGTASVDGVGLTEAGSTKIIYDDLVAVIGQDGVTPDNLAALTIRAQARATSYYNQVTTTRFRRVYSGFLSDPGLLPNSMVTAVQWKLQGETGFSSWSGAMTDVLYTPYLLVVDENTGQLQPIGGGQALENWLVPDLARQSYPIYPPREYQVQVTSTSAVEGPYYSGLLLEWSTANEVWSAVSPTVSVWVLPLNGGTLVEKNYPATLKGQAFNRPILAVGEGSAIQNCPSFTTFETDVRCEDTSGSNQPRVLNVYRRLVDYTYSNGCIYPVTLDWFLYSTQGCCDCGADIGNCCNCLTYRFTLSGLSGGCDGNDTYLLQYTGTPCVWSGVGLTTGSAAKLEFPNGMGAGSVAILTITTAGGCQAVFSGLVSNCGSFTLTQLNIIAGSGWPATLDLICGQGTGSGVCVPGTCDFCDNPPAYYTVGPITGFTGNCSVFNGTWRLLPSQTDCEWIATAFANGLPVSVSLSVAGSGQTLSFIYGNAGSEIARATFGAPPPERNCCPSTITFTLPSDTYCNCGSSGGNLCPYCDNTPSAVLFDGSSVSPAFTGDYARFAQGWEMQYYSVCEWLVNNAGEVMPFGNGTAFCEFTVGGADPTVVALQLTDVNGARITYRGNIQAGNCCSPVTLKLEGSPIDPAGGGGTYPTVISVTLDCTGSTPPPPGEVGCPQVVTAVPTCCAGTGTGTGTGSGFPGCTYTVTATLDWDTANFADLDLYVKNVTAGLVCWYNNLSAGALTLNHDAFPTCKPTPLPPEIITGDFAGSTTFNVWRNQWSDCTTLTAPSSMTFSVHNTGSVPVLVVADGVPTLIAPGGIATVLTSFNSAGYNTRAQNNFAGGNVVAITCGSTGTGVTGTGTGPTGTGPTGGVTTDCCPGQVIPIVLRATFSGSLVGLNEPGGIPIFHIGGGQWTATLGGVCGGTVNLVFSCAIGGLWEMSGNGAASFSGSASFISCPPSTILFSGSGTVGAGMCAGAYGWAVTA